MSLNPFELHGPAFLAFYVGLMLLCLLGLRSWIRRDEESAAPPPPRLDDPYLIAYLRDGATEAWRVGTVALVDRGLLRVEGKQALAADRGAAELLTRPFERAVLAAHAERGLGSGSRQRRLVEQACQPYQEQLERHGLLASAVLRDARRPKVLLAAALLLGVAGWRIGEALLAGRHNLGFLIALALLAAILLWRQQVRRRSYAGDAALADLRLLFKRLKDRAASLSAGGASNEAALLAAVFGLAALPAAAFPMVDQLYPQLRRDGGSSSSSDSGGSSCGSSSSCGGGCGGGGCGG